MDLEEKEQRYRFLYSKVDAELNKMKSMKQQMEEKRAEIFNLVGKQQVDFTLQFGSKKDVYVEVNNYISELENLKHYLSLELEKIVKQIELKNSLKKKYGDLISVSGDEIPIVRYNDPDIEDIESKYNISKRLITDLKNKMKDMS